MSEGKIGLVKSVASEAAGRVFGNKVVKVAMYFCLSLNLLLYILVAVAGIMWYVAVGNDTVAVLSDPRALTIVDVSEDEMLVGNNNAVIPGEEVKLFVSMQPGYNERYIPEEGIYARSVTVVEYMEPLIKWLLTSVFWMLVAWAVLDLYRGKRLAVMVASLSIILSWLDVVIIACGVKDFAFTFAVAIIMIKATFVIKVGTYVKN